MLIRSFAVIAAKLVFAAFAIFAFTAAAEAQFLTFVSSTGLDSRPCTVEAQPCKTLPRAVAATGAGGTIRILGDLAAQPVTTIAKSLTVEGGGKSMIGTIVINSASAVVILRDLHLTGRGAVANGIGIYSAAAVHIEDCTVERYTSDGIKLVGTTSTKLFVSDTVLRANASDGLYADDASARVEIENSRFEGNVGSGLFLKVATASVLRSVSSENGAVGIVLRTSLAKVAETTANDNGAIGLYSDLVNANVEIENSRFEGNSSSGVDLNVAKVSVTGSSASGNVGAGIVLRGPTSRITETTADYNSVNGISVLSGEVLMSFTQTSANGGASVLLASGAKLLINNCSFGGIGINNQGQLFSMQNNFGAWTGNAIITADPF